MNDEWSWWREALAGNAPEIHADMPQSGFYKMRDGKDGPWLPVMIRLDHGHVSDTARDKVLRCRVGDNSDADPFKIWTYCAGRPISSGDAKIAFETGRFPGEVAVIGDNSGDLSLADQIREYTQQALDWLRGSGITDTKSKDKAANYRAELLRLKKEADTQRESEKRPHLDASRAVDAKFKPMIETAEAAADTLRHALTVYMTAEEAKLRAEQQAKWAMEQKAIEAARAEAEKQRAKMMADDPIAAITSPELELPMAPAIPDPVKVQAGGQRGRKTGLRDVTRYVVTDHSLALAFFAQSDEVKELIGKLAERAGKAGVSVPGVEKITEKVAA